MKNRLKKSRHENLRTFLKSCKIWNFVEHLNKDAKKMATDEVKEKSENENEPSQSIDRSDMKWYVVNAYSGLENRAKKTLEERIKQYSLEDQFGEILVPVETVIEVKAGVRKESTRKCFPGYMLVQMTLTDETGHLVRNTPKITGFVGGTKNPPPLNAREVDRMRNVSSETTTPRSAIEFSEGEEVRVIEGPFTNFNGNIVDVKADKQRVRVAVSIFGRTTPVELDFAQVEKLT